MCARAEISVKEIIVFVLAVLIISSNTCLADSERTAMTRPWFSTKECTSLEIKKYKSISVHQIVSAVMIEDSTAVKNIMQRIERIPADGDMMVSFGPDAESIDLFFHCANNTTQKVAIYQKRFKTPSTGFNSETNETESSLYVDIDALLFPDLEKKFLKIKNFEYRFRDFSLTYLGTVNSEKAPVTASWATDKYLVKDKANNEQIIDIISGQRSPAPYDFDIGREGFTLLTYQTEMKDRLYPDYFQVTKR
ncbi:MAG: hypothetical protein ABI144_06250 [Gallionella sp.]